jgi:hypothetical protein
MCSGCEPYTKTQKIMLGGMVLANFLDYKTSERLHMEDDDGKIIGDRIVTFSERNFLLDDHPSRDQIALLKLGFVGLMLALGEIDPENGSRELFYGIGIGVGGAGAYHNNEMYNKYH